MTVVGDRERLDILLKDYELARLDERTLNTTQATAFNVTMAVIGLMAAGISRQTPLPDIMLAAAPLLPLALLAYLQMLGTITTVRSYYMRGLEQEIRRYAGANLQALGDISPASMIELSTVVGSLRRGRLGYRIMANLILVIITIAFGGLAVYIGTSVIDSTPLRIVMLAVYGPLAALFLWEAVMSSAGGRTLYIRTARKFMDGASSHGLPRVTRSTSASRTPPPPPGSGAMSPNRRERRLFFYLLYPRPEDLIKVMFAPVAFICAAWSTGEWDQWATFLLVWFILEYLIYLARYQWNDVRGIEDDTRHAERRSRARLPRGTGSGQPLRNVQISLLVAALRLAAAFALAAATATLIPILTLIALVLGIAIIYEALRSVSAEKAVQVADQGGDPLSPTATTVALWCLVGLGYAIRASVGFAYGGLSLTTPAALFGMVAMAAYGVMFVLMTWALEATTFCRHPTASATHPNAPWYYLDGLPRKPHIGALLRFASIRPLARASSVGMPAEPIDPSSSAYCGRHKILSRSRRLITPWSIGLAISVMSGSVLGVSLAQPANTGPWPYISTAAITLAGLVMLLLLRFFWDIVGCLAIALALSAALLPAAPDNVFLVAVPWTVVSLNYALFRESSYRDLKFFASYDFRPLRTVTRLLVGRQTATTLGIHPSNRSGS